MKLINISECKDRIGVVIPGVTGIVQKIFPRKVGETTKNGKTFPWSLQNGEISDDSGIIRFTIFGAIDEMPQDWRGKEISFLSTQGRGGLNGVLVNQNEFKGKTYLELKIDKTAKVIEGVPEVAIEDRGEVSQSTYFKANTAGIVEEMKETQDFLKKSLTLSPGGTAKASVTDSISHAVTMRKDAPQVNVDTVISKYGKLYRKCMDEAWAIRVPDSGMEISDTKDIASCFFIQGMMDGLLNHINLNETQSQLQKDEISF